MPLDLIKSAQKVRENAVAPFTNYQVGAALKTSDGQTITGCNIESAISSLSVCAERAAIFTALAAGHRSFSEIAVATKDGGTPCGVCRQLIWEFCGDIKVYVSDEKNNVTTHQMKDLLPHAFTLKR